MSIFCYGPKFANLMLSLDFKTKQMQQKKSKHMMNFFDEIVCAWTVQQENNKVERNYIVECLRFMHIQIIIIENHHSHKKHHHVVIVVQIDDY